MKKLKDGAESTGRPCTCTSLVWFKAIVNPAHNERTAMAHKLVSSTADAKYSIWSAQTQASGLRASERQHAHTGATRASRKGRRGAHDCTRLDGTITEASARHAGVRQRGAVAVAQRQQQHAQKQQHATVAARWQRRGERGPSRASDLWMRISGPGATRRRQSAMISPRGIRAPALAATS